MRFPSNKTLVKVAVYVGVSGISAVMYMRYKIQDGIKNSEYFREALKTLRQHRGAVNLLGEPIKDTGFDISDSKNFAYEQKAHFEVNVKGPKDKGKMFFWASFLPEKGWHLDRLELEVDTQPEKRFLLKKPDQSTENNKETKQEKLHLK